MTKDIKYQIDIEIDGLTNSIENAISGDSFSTEIFELIKADLKNVTKKNGWLFSWSSEHKLTDRKVYKLTIKDNPDIIQGLVSVSDYQDHFYVHLIESAPFNKGKKKLYKGVPGNLAVRRRGCLRMQNILGQRLSRICIFYLKNKAH